jgi:hypothetical protein
VRREMFADRRRKIFVPAVWHGWIPQIG